MIRRVNIGLTLWAFVVYGPWGVGSTRADENPSDDYFDDSECLPLLTDIQDNVFSFDDDAFYCYCRLVASESGPKDGVPVQEGGPVPWRFMLERPGDYRGKWVTVEGTLRRRSTFRVPDRLGDLQVHQCELSASDTRAFCTVILTGDFADLPLGTVVRAGGYFIKVRAYTTGAGETGAGPLIVARGMFPTGTALSDTSVQSKAPGLGRWFFVGTAILAMVWLVLRRRARPKPSRASARPGGGIETDEDFDWLTRPGNGTE